MNILNATSPLPSANTPNTTGSLAAATNASGFSQLLASQRGTATNDAQPVLPPNGAATKGAGSARGTHTPDEVHSDADPSDAIAPWLATLTPVALLPGQGQAAGQPGDAAGRPPSSSAQAIVGLAMRQGLPGHAPAAPFAAPLSAAGQPGTRQGADTDTTQPSRQAPGQALATPQGSVIQPGLRHQTALGNGQRPLSPSLAVGASATQAANPASRAHTPAATTQDTPTALSFGDAVQAQTGLSDLATPSSVNSHGTSALVGMLSPSATGTVSNSFLAAPTVGQAPVPLSHPDWGQQMSQQLVNRLGVNATGLQHAELRLDPPELGPLRVTLQIQDNVANAWFVSAHASVRQVVESALPQLAQQLADAGLSLGNTHVGSDQPQFQSDQQPFAQQFAHPTGTGSSALADQAPVTAATPSSRGDGLIDTYA